jgi:hypothetical protein
MATAEGLEPPTFAFEAVGPSGSPGMDAFEHQENIGFVHGSFGRAVGLSLAGDAGEAAERAARARNSAPRFGWGAKMRRTTPMRDEYDRLVASGVSPGRARAQVNAKARGLPDVQSTAPVRASVPLDVPSSSRPGRQPVETASTGRRFEPADRETVQLGPQIYRGNLTERLDSLFSRRLRGWPGRNVHEDFDFLRQGLTAGYVRIRLVRIPAHVVAKAAEVGPFASCSSESAEHLFLKAVAVEWLRSIGGHDAEEEVRISGRMDAYSRTLNWCVECGHTRVSRLRSLMKVQDGSRFTLIPFQARYDAMKGRPAQSIIAVNFEWDQAIEAALFKHDIDVMRRAMESVDFTKPRPLSASPAQQIGEGR